MMKIKNIRFIKSITKLNDTPSLERPEIAFIGRSNVGKSSLINMLAGRKNLAKTSGTPGKTQTINYFLVNDQWYAVDLPGYGWARVSKQKKINWSKFVREYLINKENLRCLFILIDVRLTPQFIDLQFLNWAVEQKIPIALIFTKIDKITKNKVIQSISIYKRTLLEEWAYLPEIFISSAVNKSGKKEILDFIESII
jgi:GTP-binding protein